MNGAQAMVKCLENEGVEMVFGYPGVAICPFYDSLLDTDIKSVLIRTEQNAAHAASGLARVTGKVGVCAVTSGPGATNLITGIATAFADSIPLVCITGQVNSELIGSDVFQEADITGAAESFVKYSYLVKNAEDIPQIFKEAFYIAKTGRPGPVVVDIPRDVFNMELDFVYPKTVKLKGYNGECIGTETDIDVFLEALDKAKKPLLFIGGGVIIAEMQEKIKELISKTNIPVISSLMGLGSIENSHNNFLGMVGMHGTYAANMAATHCDMLIGIGVRFDDRVTGLVKEFAPAAKVVHFDIDPAEINKNVIADYKVVGDLRWSLPLLCEKMVKCSVGWQEQVDLWLKQTLQWKSEQPLSYDKCADCVMPQEVIEIISELSDENTIIVTDVGQHQMWTAQFYKFRKPRTFLTSGGLGTMGYGLPAALGAKIANPTKQVVLISGDGSIMMNCQELATASDCGINVKVVVMNNRVLGMVTQGQRLF